MKHRRRTQPLLVVAIGLALSAAEGRDERAALRFSAPLTPFAIEVIATFDRDEPGYLLDVVSVVESVLDLSLIHISEPTRPY